MVLHKGPVSLPQAGQILLELEEILHIRAFHDAPCGEGGGLEIASLITQGRRLNQHIFAHRVMFKRDPGEEITTGHIYLPIIAVPVPFPALLRT
jgi:hypothetical protein